MVAQKVVALSKTDPLARIIIGLAILPALCDTALAQATGVSATGNSVAVGGDVTNSIIQIIQAQPAADLEGLYSRIAKPFEDLSKSQRDLIEKLQEDLNLSQAQIRDALNKASDAEAGKARADAIIEALTAEVGTERTKVNRAISARLADVAINEKSAARALQIALLAACYEGEGLAALETSSPLYHALFGAARWFNHSATIEYESQYLLYDIDWSAAGIAVADPKAVNIVRPGSYPNPGKSVPNSGNAYALDLSEDGDRLAFVNDAGAFVVDLKELASQRIETSFVGTIYSFAHANRPRSVSWSGGNRLAVGFYSGEIVVFDGVKRSSLFSWEPSPPTISWAKLHGAGDLVISLDWNGENLLAAGSSLGTAAVFNGTQHGGDILRGLDYSDCPQSESVCPVLSVDLSHDGRWLAIGSDDGRAVVIDWAGKGPPRFLHGGEQDTYPELRGVTGVIFDSSGRYLATATGGGLVRVWDLDADEFLSTFKVDGGGSTELAWDPTGISRIATASRDGIVRTWTWTTWDDPRQLVLFAWRAWYDTIRGSQDELTPADLDILKVDRSVSFLPCRD